MTDWTDEQKHELLEIVDTINHSQQLIEQYERLQNKMVNHPNNLGNAAMQDAAHHGLVGSMGMAGHSPYSGGLGGAGGGGGGGGGAFPSIPPAAVPVYRDAKEDMLRDLMRRIARTAGRIDGEDLVKTIHGHSETVKKLLEDFLEGSAYLQAQIPMVQAAFKSNPTLAQSVINSLNRAYTELCAQYFGDET